MKNRILALFLAMTMVATMAMGMGNVAQAAELNGVSISINEKGAVEHTYNVYQIFTGDVASDKKTLSNIQWGANVNEKTKAISAAEYAKTITQENVESLVDIIAGSPVAVIETEGGKLSAASSKLAPGYYFIDDVTAEDKLGNDSRSKFVIQVLGEDVRLDAKSGTTTFEKNVVEKNDSTGVVTDPQKASDYDIGDDVPFQFVSVIPNNYAEYKTYEFVITDKMDNGLDFNADSVVLTIKNNNDTDVVVKDLSKHLKVAEDNHSFVLEFSDLKTQLEAVKAGSTIVVDFTAKLNENAKRGVEGNKNEAYLEFSNNPNSDGKGKTPTDTVIVFTFDVVINKVDGAKNPLEGAEFALKKFDAEANEFKVFQNAIKGEKTSDSQTAPVKFTCEGLDSGIYMLEETKTPDGYNSIEPAYFVVEAVYTGADNELTGLNVYQVKNENGNWVKLEAGKTVDFGIVESFATATTDVVNNAGSILPSTGGIGTTIFYVIGGILIVGGGVMLFVRNKATKEEK